MLAIFKFCSTQFLLINTGRTHLTNLRLLLVILIFKFLYGAFLKLNTPKFVSLIICLEPQYQESIAQLISNHKKGPKKQNSYSLGYMLRTICHV